MRYITLFALTTFTTATLFSQTDSHYWTHQYGTKGLLLNGATIASPDDETALYYNPGSIGLDDNLGFAFSFITPTYSDLNFDNFLGNETNLRDRSLGFSPGFLAVRWQPANYEKFTFGVTSFKRFESNISFQDRFVSQLDNSDLYRADIDLQRRVSENWFGVGVSYNLTPKLGMGLTHFSVWHSQSIDISFEKEILSNDAQRNISLAWYSDFGYDLSIFSGWVTKFGLSYKGDIVKIGLTYTSNTYGIFRSSASYTIDDQRINVDQDDAITVSNRNNVELEAFRTAPSIGVGIEFNPSDRLSLAIATEYFKSVDQYFFFTDTDDPFDDLGSNPAEISVQLANQKDAILNVAIGMQYDANEKLTWIGGIRTDFNENSNVSIFDTFEYLGIGPDVFNFSGGALYKFKKSIFSLGFNVGIGRVRGGNQFADLSNISESNFFTFSGDSNVNGVFRSATLFLTYDFIFKSFTKKDIDSDN